MAERIHASRSLGRPLLSVAAVLGCAAVLATSCGGENEPSSSHTAADTNTAATTDASIGTTTEPSPEPFVVEGTAATRRTIEVPHDFAPLILIARYPKGDLLDVDIRGEGFRRLTGNRGGFIFDGPGGSETATPGIRRGSYELIVKGTKGRWAITLAEPNPENAPLELLQPLQGEGDVVGKVRLEEAAVLQWEMASEGLYLQGHLLGYREAEGAEQFLGVLAGGVVAEPGKIGLRSDDEMPAGDYLLIVEADGR
jgi:hypothetical protein